jgi:prevent-host-death family protein
MSTKIMPVTDLRRQTSDVIRNVQQNGDTVYITQHGRPTVVLIDYARYERMMALLKEQQPTRQQTHAAALLQSWIDEGDAAEQTATGNELIVGLDAQRLSDRTLFPAELEGESW